MSRVKSRKIESRLAQFSLLLSNLYWIIPSSLIAAIIVAIVTGEQISLNYRLGWLGGFVLILVVRVLLLFYWLRQPTTSKTLPSRINLATFFSSLTGCFFGLIGYFAISLDSPVVSLMFIMLYTGMVATATATISYMVPMYLLYVIPLMLPIGIHLLTFKTENTSWLGALVPFFLIVCFFSSRSIRASTLRSIDLRFENVELLEDLKQQHEIAEIALAREEKANQAKTRFLAAASHDLRQPLHSLRLFTATLEMQTRNSQHKTLVNQIDSSAKTLEELFNSLLDISKLDAGTVSANKRHIVLASLLSQIEIDFKAVAEEKNLAFSCRLDNAVVLTDPLLFERLIRNLVGNAIRYTNKGSVDITTSARDGRIWVSVKDTGMGIASTDHVKIFEEFVQLDNQQRDRDRGIGLGLSIVKRLGDILDVDLQLSSTLGQGATFSVGVLEGDESQCHDNQIHEQPVSDHVASLFILVVDDEEEVCRAIEGLLQTWGCIVMCATSGDAAIEQLHEIGDTPDLIISDYRLRDGETGGHAITNIRKATGNDIPAIILTGDIAPDRLQEIETLGFPLLHKPCEPDALRQLITNQTMPIEQVAFH